MKAFAAATIFLAYLLNALSSYAAEVASRAPLVQQGQVLRGEFVQHRHLAGFGAPLRSTGQFAVAPGEGLIWKSLVPIPTTVAISLHGLVQTSGDTELMRLSAVQAPQFAQFYRFLEAALAGDWNTLAERYDVVASRDGEGQVLVLRPRDDGGMLPFEAVTITLDRFVTGIVIDRHGGDSDRIRFSGFAVDEGGLGDGERTLLEATAQ